jgi:ubiquinone/menaquinone biosynthesis C-methylase UbiE
MHRSVSHTVAELFNCKAATWKRKYDFGAALSSRLVLFSELVRKSCSPGARILDFGCGTGDLAIHLNRYRFRVTGCEISEKMLAIAKKSDPLQEVNWVLLPPNWKCMPFQSGFFDAIISASVYEYLSDVRLAFRESARLLRPGGVLLLTVPNHRSVIRMIERAIRPAALWFTSTPLPRFERKVDRFLLYLALSKNRFSLQIWNSLATENGLVVDLTSTSRRDSLTMMACVRSTVDGLTRTAITNTDSFDSRK